MTPQARKHEEREKAHGSPAHNQAYLALGDAFFHAKNSGPKEIRNFQTLCLKIIEDHMPEEKLQKLSLTRKEGTTQLKDYIVFLCSKTPEELMLPKLKINTYSSPSRES